jgi:hypothetical protein
MHTLCDTKVYLIILAYIITIKHLESYFKLQVINSQVLVPIKLILRLCVSYIFVFQDLNATMLQWNYLDYDIEIYRLISS